MGQMLSQNFSLLDLTKSPTAIRKGIDNTPDEDSIANLSALCSNILEPLKSVLNSYIIITSGYRSPKLNKAIGGSKTSSHCFGEAVDFSVPGISNIELYEFIKNSDLAYDQNIAEFLGPEGRDGWVHISYRVGNNRKQCLIATKDGTGKTIYTPDN